MRDAKRFEKRTMQEALRRLSHAYEEVSEAVAALKSARAPELAEQIDDLQDAILTAQGQIFAAIDTRFAPFESQ